MYELRVRLLTRRDGVIFAPSSDAPSSVALWAKTEGEEFITPKALSIFEPLNKLWRALVSL